MKMKMIKNDDDEKASRETENCGLASPLIVSDCNNNQRY